MTASFLDWKKDVMRIFFDFFCLFFKCNGTKIFQIPHCEGRIQRSVDSRWWGRVQACVCASQWAKNFMKSHFPISYTARTTDTQRELFFKNLEFLGLGWHFGLKVFAAFGGFSAGLSEPILVLWVPCSCFPLFNHYIFLKKLSFHIQLQNVYL